MSGEGNAPAGFLVAVLGFPAGIKPQQNLYNKLALKQHHYRRTKGREQTLYPKTYKQTFAPAIMLGLFFISKAYNAQNFCEKQHYHRDDKQRYRAPDIKHRPVGKKLFDFTKISRRIKIAPNCYSYTQKQQQKPQQR